MKTVHAETVKSASVRTGMKAIDPFGRVTASFLSAGADFFTQIFLTKTFQRVSQL